MSEPLIISVSGLRGIIGEALNPIVAARYVAAFAAEAPPGPLIVSRDGRTTGPMLRQAVTAALSACGREVWDLDVASTPTVGVEVAHRHAAGAIQISASHNPPQYNGIKLFGPDGRVLTASAGAKVKARYLTSEPQWQGFEQVGAILRLEDAHSEHLRRVLSTVDVDAIRQKQYRVLLDSNRGAGSVLGVRLLEALGCDVVALGDSPDGRFDHPPEPLAENLQGIAAAVLENRCQIGFCQDPDADRLALIDATGRYIGEEFTVALCVQRVLQQRVGPIVTNCATSSMTEHVCKRVGAPLYRSAVGEANVADEMLRTEAIYGGEGNGGPIDPRVGLVRDSFVGMAQVLDLMAASGQSLQQLAQSMPPLQIVKSKVNLSADQLRQRIDAIESGFPEAQCTRPDGLRISWPDGSWLIVRGSNTEPIVRLIAEAPTVTAAQGLCDRAAALLGS